MTGHGGPSGDCFMSQELRKAESQHNSAAYSPLSVGLRTGQYCTGFPTAAGNNYRIILSVRFIVEARPSGELSECHTRLRRGARENDPLNTLADFVGLQIDFKALLITISSGMIRLRNGHHRPAEETLCRDRPENRHHSLRHLPGCLHR
jgi:hypothetical protein